MGSDNGAARNNSALSNMGNSSQMPAAPVKFNPPADPNAGMPQPLMGNIGSQMQSPVSSVSPTDGQNMIMQYLNSLNNPAPPRRFIL